MKIKTVISIYVNRLILPIWRKDFQVGSQNKIQLYAVYNNTRKTKRFRFKVRTGQIYMKKIKKKKK